MSAHQATHTALHDEVFMKGLVESEDEYMRVKILAHCTGRIREQGLVNGAWFVPEDESGI
jgi:hypothetical protein